MLAFIYFKTLHMKKLYFSVIAFIAGISCTHAQLTLVSQFVNPCGGDEHNEFIVAKSGATPINIADISFGSYNPVDAGNNPVVNYNFWWSGTNAAASPYPIFSDFPGESCGSGLTCYGFRYPSIPADAADITTLINQLNTIAGCNVFLPVPATDIIPANSNVVIFMGAGYRNANGLCGFDRPATLLNFSNHCSGGSASATYYAIFGNGAGAGPNCTTTSGGYFSNSARRVSILFTFSGGDNTVAGNYSSSYQDYDPGSGTGGGDTTNAWVITPDENADTTRWINNQGCVPPPFVVLPVKLEYFTAVLKDKEGYIKWQTTYEADIREFVIEKSLNGKDFFTLQQVAPKNSSNSSYDAVDASLAIGNNFYRLKTVNLDGTVEYSSIVKINFSKGAPSGWFIYPNPVKNSSASLVYQSTTTKKITVNVTDAAGKTISTQAYTVTAGNNKIEIPVQHISAGMYMVSIFSEGLKETAAFIKQ